MRPTASQPGSVRALAPPPVPRLADERALLDEVRARLFGIPRTRWQLGRYRVVATLGMGAAGTVLRAHDPELDREVAIKLLHPRDRPVHGGGSTIGAATQLLHEARALGRLAHPNVVAVYDVGRVDDGHLERGSVYMVMELVEGESLAAWLARPRTVPEILAAFVAAGHGLAAAHALGLLHRDFKPDNVLCGRDARVRVADFGLSCARADAHASGDVVVGTPLYMAPEQHRGEPLDPRCDQYAFCSALRDALWGRPVLADLDEVLESKRVAPVLPSRAGVSHAVRLAIERGLQPDRDARWPTMAALLSVLGRGESRSRVPVVSAACATLGLAVVFARPSASADPCDGGDVEAVWGHESRAAVNAAFAREPSTRSDEVLVPLDTRMAALEQGWIEAHARACAERDTAMLGCLQQQRARAHALVELWRDGGAGAARAAVPAALALDDAEACERVPTPSVPLPLDEDVIAIDARLASGSIAEAAALADTALARLDQLPPETAASLALSIGRAFAESGRSAAAATVLARGFDAAQAADDHPASVRTAALSVTVVGAQLGRTDDAETWARHGAAALARAGDPPQLRAVLERHLGHLAGGRGRWEEAREHYRSDATAVLASDGDGSLAYARALDNVANAELHLGDARAAIDTYARVLATKRPLLGAHHPDVATTLHNLAIASLQVDELDEAERLGREALSIWIDAFGEPNPDVALARYTLGTILLSRRRFDAAIEELQRALDQRRVLLGDEHPDTLGTMVNLATALDDADRPQLALALLEDVVRVHERPDVALPDRGVTLLDYGNLLRRTGRVDDARAVHLRAIEQLQRERDGQLATAVAWYSLAMDDRLLGQPALAERELDRAIAGMRPLLPESNARWIGFWREQGHVLAALDRGVEAREALERALALATAVDDDELESTLQRELRALGGAKP